MYTVILKGYSVIFNGNVFRITEVSIINVIITSCHNLTTEQHRFLIISPKARSNTGHTWSVRLSVAVSSTQPRYLPAHPTHNRLLATSKQQRTEPVNMSQFWISCYNQAIEVMADTPGLSFVGK